jgi:hypothetical protein
MNKATNVENISLLGKSYPILCDKLEIKISVIGGYKHIKECSDNTRLLSDTQSLSSLFNFYLDIPHYLSPTIKQEQDINDSELNKKLDYLSKRHLPIIACDEILYDVHYSDYDYISTFNIDLFLYSDNRNYRLNLPISFTYEDFIHAIQKDKYSLDFLFDLALQDKLDSETPSQVSKYFRLRYSYTFNLPDVSIRDDNGNIELFNLTVACIFAILAKNFPEDHKQLMMILEPDINVI